MTTLKPCEEFICDHCHEAITVIADGIMVSKFKKDASGHGDFKIIHKVKCDKWYDDCSWWGLSDFFPLNANSLAIILPILDIWPMIAGDSGEQTIPLNNVRWWVELMQRLYMPYYEEAREYPTQFRTQYYNNGENEVTAFSWEKFLKEVIFQGIKNT